MRIRLSAVSCERISSGSDREFFGVPRMASKGRQATFFRKKNLSPSSTSPRVQKAGAVFNQEKLNWLNREYLKKMSDAEIAEAAQPFFAEAKISADAEKIARVISVVRGRASTLRDFVTMGALFFDLPEYDPALLVWQKTPSSPAQIAEILGEVRDTVLATPAKNFAREQLTAAIMGMVGERKRGEILWPLRVALSGQAASPDPVEIMEAIGKEESLRRIEIAIKKCGA